VGTGLSDEEREWWQRHFDQPLRTTALTIRWRAMERTVAGIPRHPSYQGIYEGE